MYMLAMIGVYNVLYYNKQRKEWFTPHTYLIVGATGGVTVNKLTRLAKRYELDSY